MLPGRRYTPEEIRTDPAPPRSGSSSRRCSSCTVHRLLWRVTARSVQVGDARSRSCRSACRTPSCGRRSPRRSRSAEDDHRGDSSRTALEAMITEFNLYRERAVKPMEDIVDDDAQRIELDVAPPAPGSGASGRAGHGVPRDLHARRQAQCAAGHAAPERSAVDENSRMRGTLAKATNQFLETQLADARRSSRSRSASSKRSGSATGPAADAAAVEHAGRAEHADADSGPGRIDRARSRSQDDARAALQRGAARGCRRGDSAPPGRPAATDPLAMPAKQAPAQRLAVARTALASLRAASEARAPGHPPREAAHSRPRGAGRERGHRQAQADPTAAPPAAVTPDQLARADSLRRQRAEIESLDRQMSVQGIRGAAAARADRRVPDARSKRCPASSRNGSR